VGVESGSALNVAPIVAAKKRARGLFRSRALAKNL
jgi:hypothetical protein